MNILKKISVGVLSLAFVMGIAAMPASAEITAGNNLGNLFVLNELFSDNSGILGSGDTSLGNLFILEQLFDGTSIGSNRLGDLFVLNELFSDNSGILGSSSGTNLGNLLILDQLFGGGGVFDGLN